MLSLLALKPTFKPFHWVTYIQLLQMKLLIKQYYLMLDSQQRPKRRHLVVQQRNEAPVYNAQCTIMGCSNRIRKLHLFELK